MNVTLLRRTGVLLGLATLLVLIAAPISRKAQNVYRAQSEVQTAQFTHGEFAARFDRLDDEWAAVTAEKRWAPILAASEDEVLAVVQGRSDQLSWRIQSAGVLVGEIRWQGTEAEMWRTLIEAATLFPEAELDHFEAAALGDDRVQLQMRLRLAWRAR